MNNEQITEKDVLIEMLHVQIQMLETSIAVRESEIARLQTENAVLRTHAGNPDIHAALGNYKVTTTSVTTRKGAMA